MAKDNLQNKELAFRILLKPWITEAATVLAEQNKYVFVVSPEATKKQIILSIESLYGVKVLAVNTIKIPRKLKNYGRTPGWKTGIKKAIVKLKAGDKIDLFEEKK
jgi:large subunit ribosomal protein L23